MRLEGQRKLTSPFSTGREVRAQHPRSKCQSHQSKARVKSWQTAPPNTTRLPTLVKSTTSPWTEGTTKIQMRWPIDNPGLRAGRKMLRREHSPHENSNY